MEGHSRCMDFESKKQGVAHAYPIRRETAAEHAKDRLDPAPAESTGPVCGLL